MDVLSAIWDFIKTAGVPGLLFVALVLALYGNYKGWWVSGREYRGQAARADKFEKLYDDAAALLRTTLAATQDSNANLRAQVELMERLLPPKQPPGAQPL